MRGVEALVVVVVAVAVVVVSSKANPLAPSNMCPPTPLQN